MLLRSKMKKLMKKLLSTILLSVLLALSINGYAEYVKGYYKSNGTYVNGYHRSDGNNTVKDNYSYYGNTNPHTGKTGTNKYYDNPTSDYYKAYQKQHKWTD